MSGPSVATATASGEQVVLGRRFTALLVSTGLANLGDGVLGTLAPLVALSLTTSPGEISLLSAATWLPWLVFGLAAGAVIDRVERRRVQVLALAVRSGVLGIGAGLGATGRLTLPLLVLLVLLYGVTEVFADLAATSIVPDLVPARSLPKANGRVIGVQQVANSFLGAPLAGVLVVLGAGFGFGVSAALAALAALVLVVGLRGRISGSQPAVRSGVRAPLKEGLGFLARHAVMRPVVITGSVLNLASTAYFAVFVLWAVGPTSAMRLTEAQFPLIMVGFAAGAVLGSLLADAVQRRLGEVVTMVSMLAGSVLLMLVPVVLPTWWAVAAALTAIGVTNTIGNVVSQSLRQRLVPRELLGRVSGAARTLAYGLMPVGALLGGAVAEVAGLPATFLGAVGLSLIACGYLAWALRNGTELPGDADPAGRAAGAAA